MIILYAFAPAFERFMYAASVLWATPRPKTRSARSSSRTGATGRYHSRRLMVSLTRRRSSGSSARARMLR